MIRTRGRPRFASRERVKAKARAASVPIESERRRLKRRSVVNGHAGNVGMLQRAANRLGLVAIKAGETGAEQLAVALGDGRLGKRVGLGEQAMGLAAGGLDALLGFVLAFERTDLDDPSGVDRDRLGRGVLRSGLRLRRRR